MIADLILSLADNKQLLGYRYAEWSIRAPSLEADIAAAAMGLDDIGHSRVLYGCLEPLGDPRGDDRPGNPEAYRNVAMLDHTWTDWSHFVAANAVLDAAFSAFIQACVEGRVEVLRTRLRKMLQEERFHQMHGRSWMKEHVAPEAVARAWHDALAWFGPPGGDIDRLRQSGELALGTRELVALTEEKSGVGAPDGGPDWSVWDPVRRRHAAGGVDPDTFAKLSGITR